MVLHSDDEDDSGSEVDIDALHEEALARVEAQQSQRDAMQRTSSAESDDDFTSPTSASAPSKPVLGQKVPHPVTFPVPPGAMKLPGRTVSPPRSAPRRSPPRHPVPVKYAKQPRLPRAPDSVPTPKTPSSSATSRRTPPSVVPIPTYHKVSLPPPGSVTSTTTTARLMHSEPLPPPPQSVKSLRGDSLTSTATSKAASSLSSSFTTPSDRGTDTASARQGELAQLLPQHPGAAQPDMQSDGHSSVSSGEAVQEHNATETSLLLPEAPAREEMTHPQLQPAEEQGHQPPQRQPPQR
eukprot:Sspe_Gene.11460::Locus_3876_Transcript_1_1_Confidence_1.000_Length_926::g.11460::m.11460